MVHSRVDLETYRDGLAVCENFIVLPHGVLAKRPGTRYVAATKDPARKVRLEPFEYSVTDTYVLEFGHLYMRFYRFGGQILDSNDDVYEIVTPYEEGQLPDIDFAQDDRTLYLVHEKHPPKQLVRNDHDDWALSDITFSNKPTEWTTDNYPRRIGFFEQRMVLASTPDQPNTYWLSKSPSGTSQDLQLKDFGLGTADDDGIKITTTSGQAQEIQWLIEDRHLVSGTSGGIRTIGGAGYNEALTLKSIQNRMQTKEGASTVKPLKAGDSVLYLSRNRQRLHETRFTFEKEGWVSPPISVGSEHITKPGIGQMAYSDEPDSIIWMARDDGQLVGVTYDPNQSLLGFHRHKLGGTADGKDHAVVESVACAFEGQRRALYLAVKRDINGSTVRTVERLEPLFRQDDGLTRSDAFFVDCGGTYDGAEASSISGFDHLAGEDVDILADGAVLPRATVAGDGSITLPNETSAAKVQVGLHYDAKMRPMVPVYETREGTVKSKSRRIVDVSVDLFESGSVIVGPPGGNTERRPLRSSALQFGEVEPLYTQDETVPFSGNSETSPMVEVTSDEPLPCTIRGLIMELEVV